MWPTVGACRQPSPIGEYHDTTLRILPVSNPIKRLDYRQLLTAALESTMLSILSTDAPIAPSTITTVWLRSKLRTKCGRLCVRGGMHRPKSVGGCSCTKSVLRHVPRGPRCESQQRYKRSASAHVGRGSRFERRDSSGGKRKQAAVRGSSEGGLPAAIGRRRRLQQLGQLGQLELAVAVGVDRAQRGVEALEVEARRGVDAHLEKE
jgi:hypothetical protein|eukprot:6462425-Prymnesium_polylepis.1